MKLTKIAAGAPALLKDDGSAVALEAVVDAIVSAIKEHGHYGNLAHHISGGGDWDAYAAAIRQLLFGRSSYGDLGPLARNVARSLSGRGPENIRPFRGWFFDRLEIESSMLHRMLVERRIETLNEDAERSRPRFRKSALSILTSH
ncbi:hypothetical protein ACFSX5_09805 [Devosia albogilva]|uniref:Uncharacterized protein n=1 Tax=Devosia albogilva TaxID=429726 RepID=A0ABW5QL70_9HYPH